MKKYATLSIMAMGLLIIQHSIAGQNPDPCRAKLPGCSNYYGSELYDTCNYFKGRIRIPVIFHIVHRSSTQNIPTARILSELADLNRDFLAQNADINAVQPGYKYLISNPDIEFYLADLNDKRFSEPGIIRKHRGLLQKPYNASEVIDPAHYMNVYIYNRSGDGGHTFPTPWVNPGTDAVYVDYGDVGKGYRLLTHETGHWLGLMHTFECGECSDAGDGISDTPAQTGSSDGAFKILTDDPAKFSINCNGQRNMYHNFMDYSLHRKMFTAGQVKRMRIILSAMRRSMISL